MRDVLLISVLVLAVAFDLRSFRIPNALIIVALVMGVGSANVDGGLPAAMASLLGGLTGLIAFLPFWLARWMGAGDVKLLAVIGTFAGFPSVLWVALYTMLAGGAMGLLLMSVARRTLPDAGQIASVVLRAARTARRDPGGDVSPAVARQGPDGLPRLPYALALAGGTLIWRFAHG